MTAKPTKPTFVTANILAVVSCFLSVWASMQVVIGLQDFDDYLYRPDPPLLAVEHFPGAVCGLLAIIVAYMAMKLVRKAESSKPGLALAKIGLLLGGGAFVANGVLVFKILVYIFMACVVLANILRVHFWAWFNVTFVQSEPKWLKNAKNECH